MALKLFKPRQRTDRDYDTGVLVTSDREPSRFANALAKSFATTSKQLVWVYTINGIAWIWCSYILAFMGREQIAEALSSNVCSVVIGQIGFYMVTKTIENIFKYNNVIGPWRVGIKKEDDQDECNIPEPVISEPVPGFSGGTEDCEPDEGYDDAVG